MHIYFGPKNCSSINRGEINMYTMSVLYLEQHEKIDFESTFKAKL